MADCRLGDTAAEALSDGLASSEVEEVDLSGNDLSQASIRVACGVVCL